MAEIYYTAPSEEAFNEMKRASIAVWETKGNEGGYSDDKISRIKDIKNTQDNFMYMLAMFDTGNQSLVCQKLSDKTREAVRVRLVDGGNPEFMINEILN